MSWAFHKTFSSTTGIPRLHYCQIDDYVFIGGAYGKLGKRVLLNFGIRHSINLQEEDLSAEDRLGPHEGYLHLPTPDNEAISEADIALGLSFIENCKVNKKKVYVHCKSGIGRAPTLGIAYLQSNGMSFDSAWKMVSTVRPFILISDAQRKQLVKYDAIGEPKRSRLLQDRNQTLVAERKLF